MPVDREGATRGQLVLVSRAHDQRAAAAHLFMEKADGVVLMIVRAEAVGAHQLGQAIGLVSVGAAYRAHFVENDFGAGFGRLPGSFRAGKTAADDMDDLGHGGRYQAGHVEAITRLARELVKLSTLALC